MTPATAPFSTTTSRLLNTLSHANPKAIKFRYGGFGRTASVGPDFKLEYKEFTLNAGDTTLDIDIPIFDDNAIEGDETMTIYVYATSGITIPDYFVYADGTIIDDDYVLYSRLCSVV